MKERHNLSHLINKTEICFGLHASAAKQSEIRALQVQKQKNPDFDDVLKLIFEYADIKLTQIDYSEDTLRSGKYFLQCSHK